MKARAAFFTVLLGSTFWLFLSDAGKRRRGQLMGLFGRGADSEDAQSSSRPTEPLPFPQSQPRQEPTESSTEAAATTAAVTPEAVAPVAQASVAPQAPPDSAITMAAPTPEVAQAVPSATEQVTDVPGPEGTAEAPESLGPEGTSVQIEEVTEGQQDESNARLEEVLQELVEEIETHSIGQEPDVKVEEELDQATIQEIGLADQPLAEATQPDLPDEPAPADTRWVGNRRKMIAHAPGGARLPAEENRVYFATREEAANAGYRIIEHEEH